jgi:hypothetical protein
MGWRFRRTMQITPGLRLNLSRSGPSVSFGPRGLHYTVGMKGTRTTVGISGSGLFWTSYKPYSSGRRPLSSGSAPPPGPAASAEAPPAMDASATSFESAEIEQLVASSTSELAPQLNVARKQWPYHPFVLFAALAVLVVAIASGLQPLAIGALVFGGVAWPAIFVLDRKRLTTTLDYNLRDDQNQAFGELVRAFEGLASCARVWRIPRKKDQRDWKRNAGAGVDVERQRISLRLGLPNLIKSNLEFPTFPLGNETIYFAPDAVLIVARNSIATLTYEDCELFAGATRFIESEGAPSDTQVVGATWQYVNKNGGPDRRFSNNRQLPICIYGQIDLKSSGGLNERLECSRADAAKDFVACTAAMRRMNSAATTMRDEVPIGDMKETPASPVTVVNAIKSKGTTPTQGDDLVSAYQNETDIAKKLALEHGKLWEFLLVQELMNSRLALLEGRYAVYQATRGSDRKQKQCSASEFGNLVATNMNRLAPSFDDVQVLTNPSFDQLEAGLRKFGSMVRFCSSTGGRRPRTVSSALIHTDSSAVRQRCL